MRFIGDFGFNNISLIQISQLRLTPLCSGYNRYIYTSEYYPEYLFESPYNIFPLPTSQYPYLSVKYYTCSWIPKKNGVTTINGIKQYSLSELIALKLIPICNFGKYIYISTNNPEYIFESRIPLYPLPNLNYYELKLFAITDTLTSNYNPLNHYNSNNNNNSFTNLSISKLYSDLMEYKEDYNKLDKKLLRVKENKLNIIPKDKINDPENKIIIEKFNKVDKKMKKLRKRIKKLKKLIKKYELNTQDNNLKNKIIELSKKIDEKIDEYQLFF